MVENYIYIIFGLAIALIILCINYSDVLVFLICLIYLQGKVVHQGLSIQSTFSQRVRLQQILSLTEDVRFYYKRLRSNRVELEPRRKTKVCVQFHQSRHP